MGNPPFIFLVSAVHAIGFCPPLSSRPLKSILLSDIQQYNYQTSIVNLQVFVSLGIETCRFL